MSARDFLIVKSRSPDAIGIIGWIYDYRRKKGSKEKGSGVIKFAVIARFFLGSGLAVAVTFAHAMPLPAARLNTHPRRRLASA
jgi:hypothetical protein